MHKDRHPINIDTDIIYKRMDNREIPFLKIDGVLRMPLPFYEVLNMCDKFAKSHFGKGYDFNDFLGYFRVELSLYNICSDKWCLVCQLICAEYCNVVNFKTNYTLNYIETLFCPEYKKFVYEFFKLSIEKQIEIYNIYAKENNLDLILESEYQTSCWYEMSELQTLIIKNVEYIFFSESWVNYIDKFQILCGCTILEIYTKTIFKKDYFEEFFLHEYKFEYDIELETIENFYDSIFQFDIIDCDYIELINIFYLFKRKFKWANRSILKWYVFKFYPNRKNDKCFDIEDYFKMNYSLFYQKYKQNEQTNENKAG